VRRNAVKVIVGAPLSVVFADVFTFRFVGRELVLYLAALKHQKLCPAEIDNFHSGEPLVGVNALHFQ
jgi:hypothetical protein